MGKEYVEGARFPVEWSPGTPEGAAFQKDFQNNYAREPGSLEAYGYDAAALLVEAWTKGQADTRRSVATYLASLAGHPALTGPLTATREGDLAGTAKMMAVRQKKFVPVGVETQ